MNVTRKNHTKLGTVVFNSASQRALVYKVADRWVCRVGKASNACVTGIESGGVTCGFSTRKAAESYASKMLGGE